MSGEVEVPNTPDWLKSLEEKRERRLKARLGHEAGAGAPCLKCDDKCPGLDLHFWRKNCKICRCSKEDHDTHDDDIYSWAQFELLGSKPNKIKTKIVLPGKKDEVELEWAPRGQKDTIDKYLKTLPPEKIPVKGSQAAQERKQALQKQIPIHDIDPSLCHELNEDEVQKMNEYIAHVKRSSVGVGQIVNLSNVIKANLHNISPQEAHIIASRYSKGIPYTEIVKLQTGLAKNLEKLTVKDRKNKNLPNMQPQPGFDNKESIQNPAIGSKMRDLTYQNFLNSDQTASILNPHYAQGLYPKQTGVNLNDHVRFDHNIDEKLLQGTDFDPTKTPSQFKGYHTQGYRPMVQQPSGGEPAQGYFDDVNTLLQNTDKISGALNHGKVPYDVAYGENLQTPNTLYSGHIPGKAEKIQGLPYNQVREGFKPCGVEHQVNVNLPNYSQNLGKSDQNIPNPDASGIPYNQVKEGFKPCGVEHQVNVKLPNYSQNLGKNDNTIPNSHASDIPYNQVREGFKPSGVEYQLNVNPPNYSQNLSKNNQNISNSNISSLPYSQVREGYMPCGVNHQSHSSDVPNYAQTLDNSKHSNQNIAGSIQNFPFQPCGAEPQNTLGNQILDKCKASQGNIENHSNQFPLYAQGLAENMGPNQNIDSEKYGFENPMFNIHNAGIQKPSSYQQDNIHSENQNPTAPKNMRDLVYSTYDPSNALSSPDDPTTLRTGDKKVPFDPPVFENINTQHGSLGYVPGTNTDQMPSGGSLRHPLLDKYGNVESNPAYIDELGNSRLKSGEAKVSGLKNLFEPKKSARVDPMVSKSEFNDPRNLNQDGNDPRMFAVDPKDSKSASLKRDRSAFYGPKGENYDVGGSRMGGVNPSDPTFQGFDAFYDSKGQNYDPNDPRWQVLDPRDPGIYPKNAQTQGVDPNEPGLRRRLPQMQPGSFNISEEYMHPSQVNIGAIRDINYPDIEIKEAMIATHPDDDFYGEDYSPDSIKELINNVILPNCHYCKKPFEENEFAVTIERANVLFHAGCFKCAGCNQSLADNIYFYHKESNNVYCGRDYAKIKGYPRCNACDELIFTKEYCLAENATFHLKHFCCFQCDTPLAGKEYTLEDEQPYCLPCFEMTKASKCSTCQNVIKPDERGCNLNGVHFHAEDDCFACIVCKKPLMGQKLLLRNEKLFCSHDCFNSVR